jgi:DNA-binding transcriptional LysR family regulator
MEVRHVRSFLSLAKTLNFSRTAEIVHLSQPALSLQIQALEEEIGGKLFERDRRKTVLTAAGVAFQKVFEFAGDMTTLISLIARNADLLTKLCERLKMDIRSGRLLILRTDPMQEWLDPLNSLLFGCR